MTLPTPESYWMESAPGRPRAPLPEDITADVVVVGAGIAGVSVAWELARAGRTVTILEADRVASGVTGNTTAKLTAQHGLIYDRLRKSFDADTARLYARCQSDAVEHAVLTAAQLRLACDLERAPAFTYAESPDLLDQVRAEAEAAAEAGLPASFVTATGLPFPVAGAVRVEHQAQFHPRRYLLGLVDRLERSGATVYERTRVVGLDEGEPCTLHTEDGVTVTARDVVIATHYPIVDRALLFGRLRPRRELVVAAVVPASADPGGMYITPEDNTRSVRTAPHSWRHRLLIVTGEAFTPGTDSVEERYERLADWTRQRFGVTDLAYRWAAQDNDTPDRLPYIGRLHRGAEHAYVATGFGGWGMSNGVLAGRLLVELMAGREPPEAALFDPRRLHPVVEAPALVRANLSVARHFVGDRLRRSYADSVDEIAPGTGAVVRVHGERCAVYRDEAGALTSVSATCTHLGCVVHFNDAERSWDCPCHGSRFATDGGVLQGPAVHPLEPREAAVPSAQD